MHEISLIQNIMQVILEKANAHRAKRVTKVFVTIGESSGVNEDSIRYYLDQYSSGTMMEGALLEFENAVATVRCQKCGWVQDVTEIPLVCPSCLSKDPTIEPHRGVSVKNIEVETV